MQFPAVLGEAARVGTICRQKRLKFMRGLWYSGRANQRRRGKVGVFREKPACVREAHGPVIIGGRVAPLWQ